MSESYEDRLNQMISTKNEQLADYRTQLMQKDDLLKQKCDLLDDVSKHEESMARELAAKDAEIERLIRVLATTARKPPLRSSTRQTIAFLKLSVVHVFRWPD